MLHLITTCTQQKRLPPGPGMVLGQRIHSARPLVSLARVWMESATLATLQHSIPAAELYQGAHWSTAQQAAHEHNAQLHILSAGLGLLQSTDVVPGYQATFSPGKEDSIPATIERDATRFWWQYLSHHRLPNQTAPRSLETLMQMHPHDRFVIVASLPYVRAIAQDLEKGLHALSSPNAQCLIVTAGGPIPAGLSPYVLRSQQKMQPWLGGSMMTLNIRLGNQILAQARNYYELSVVRSKIEDYTNQIKLIQPRRQGRKSSEKEVLEFIVALRHEQPEISASKALRLLRDSGRAFEEKRFRRLFSSIGQAAIP